MAPSKAGRGRHPQVAAGLDAASGHAGLGVGHIAQQALAVLQKGTALVGQGDAPRGAHQELDAQVLLQRVQSAPHNGRGHAFGAGGGGQAALGGHCHKGFEGFEFVHRAATFAKKSRVHEFLESLSLL